MRRTLYAPLVLAALTGFAFSDGNGPPDPHGGMFFRDPDKETASRIGDCIARMATGSVLDRARARHELESIGYWAVDPLIAVSGSSEYGSPMRGASILVLDAIRDRRALDAMRAAVSRENSDRYVAAFAALALGRFRDAASVEPFAAAVKTTKSMDLLKASVAFALAKIHTPEARELLVERARAAGAKEPVRSAALLALGFFPEAAVTADGAEPGPELASGLASNRRGERQAALLAFLVAASARADIRTTLHAIADKDGAPEVVALALLGLSRSSDASVTQFLAETASRQGDDRVRELAADLLIDRVDAATLPMVVQVARSASSARLRAAAVLALGRLEEDAARKVVLEKLGDRAPVVRAAAAVALTRRNVAGAREAAIAALEPRIRRGETNDDVRANFEKARAVLAGQRTDVRWTEIGSEILFSEMPLTFTQRLLRAVNDRAMACLDLEKIQNLQTDTEIIPSGPGGPVVPGGGDTPGGDVDPGSGDPAPPAPPPPDTPSTDTPSDGPAVGAPRTSQYQELRDLKVELLRNPYFVESDLPAPPTTPGAAK